MILKSKHVPCYYLYEDEHLRRYMYSVCDISLFAVQIKTKHLDNGFRSNARNVK
ncbi:hypothetical protein WN55_00863 [Dufourea novaeangliae]|uniref:Uncharacterized protein n=1 Tax=Dufourea novaeangliae TaxID=178035 RepID=A0A154PEM0_DUFNO|nr:hypothetical protein WN55_00863 [Dufourea novaeangliae]